MKANGSSSSPVTSIAVLLFSLFFSPYALTETITLVTGEWAPYTSSKAGEGKVAETVVIEAFKQEGIDVKLEHYPWKRSYTMVVQGEAEGTFPWYSNEEHRAETIESKEVLIKAEEVFFYQKSHPFDWSTFEDLKKYSIGGTIGYSHVALLKSHGINVDAVATDELNFKKLEAGRIDLFPASKLVGLTLVKSMFGDKASEITYHPKPLSEGEAFILFSKKTGNGQRLSDTFDKGLKKLKESGRYKQIFDEFLNEM